MDTHTGCTEVQRQNSMDLEALGPDKPQFKPEHQVQQAATAAAEGMTQQGEKEGKKAGGAEGGRGARAFESELEGNERAVCSIAVTGINLSIHQYIQVSLGDLSEEYSDNHFLVDVTEPCKKKHGNICEPARLSVRPGPS